MTESNQNTNYMTTEERKILEEFGDDVQKLCAKIIDLREIIEDRDEEIANLNNQLNNPE